MHEIKAHGTKTFTCDDCDSAFVDQSGLNRHVRLVHEKRRDYKCDLCNETFQNHSHLVRHLSGVKHNQIGSAIKGHECDICGKIFVNDNDLNRHFLRLHVQILVISTIWP